MTCVEEEESTRVSASMLPGVAQLGTEPLSPLGKAWRATRLPTLSLLGASHCAVPLGSCQ